MKHPFNLKDPIHLMAVGFGSGLPKFAPGTWGTVGAIPFFYLLVQLPLLYFYIVVAIAAIAGVYICGKCAKDIGVHDHGSIVWDEFVGLWITLLLLPIQGYVHWIWVAVGFIWFRLFDIWKPFPISILDKKVHGGLGIMSTIYSPVFLPSLLCNLASIAMPTFTCRLIKLFGLFKELNING